MEKIFDILKASAETDKELFEALAMFESEDGRCCFCGNAIEPDCCREGEK
jgi:hypothetical protein